MLAILLTLCLASSAFAMAEPQAEGKFLSALAQLGMNMLEAHLGFSISSLYQTVLAIGGQLYTTFISVLTQLVFAGTAVWNAITPIFTQLMTDLVNHAADAAIYISAALSQVQGVLTSVGRRDLDDAIPMGKFLSALAQLGMNMLEAHLGFSIATLWDTVVAIGGQLYTAFVQVLTQLVFAGTAVWNMVTPIFTQLMTDLVNHAADASTYIWAALSQVQGVLTSVGRRGLTEEESRFIDYMLNLFGLTGVWDTITSLGSAVVLAFTNVLAQLLFVGTAVLNQVTPIFAQLVTDLTNHVADALPLVMAALGQVTSILQG